MAILSCSYFLFGCGNMKNMPRQPTDPLNNECLIKLYSGTNSVVLGLTTFDEIEEKFGRGVKSKKKFKSFTVENIFPNTEHFLSYPAYGIRFSTQPQGRLSAKRVAVELVLTANCPCKTKERIGIGSKHSELNQAIGYERLTIVVSEEGKHTMVGHGFKKSPVGYIAFICSGEKTSFEFRTEKIMMVN